MNIKKFRNYIFLLIIIWTIPFMTNSIFELLNGDRGDTLFFTIVFILFLTNLIFVHLQTKLIWWRKLVFALIIVITSITLSAIAVRINLFPNSDPYGIMTFVFGNGLFSILVWEIIHQLSKVKTV